MPAALHRAGTSARVGGEGRCTAVVVDGLAVDQTDGVSEFDASALRGESQPTGSYACGCATGPWGLASPDAACDSGAKQRDVCAVTVAADGQVSQQGGPASRCSYYSIRLGYLSWLPPLWSRCAVLCFAGADCLRLERSGPGQPGADWVRVCLRRPGVRGGCRLSSAVRRGCPVSCSLQAARLQRAPFATAPTPSPPQRLARALLSASAKRRIPPSLCAQALNRSLLDSLPIAPCLRTSPLPHPPCHYVNYVSAPTVAVLHAPAGFTGRAGRGLRRPGCWPCMHACRARRITAAPSSRRLCP